MDLDVPRATGTPSAIPYHGPWDSSTREGERQRPNAWREEVYKSAVTPNHSAYVESVESSPHFIGPIFRDWCDTFKRVQENDDEGHLIRQTKKRIVNTLCVLKTSLKTGEFRNLLGLKDVSDGEVAKDVSDGEVEQIVATWNGVFRKEQLRRVMGLYGPQNTLNPMDQLKGEEEHYMLFLLWAVNRMARAILKQTLTAIANHGKDGKAAIEYLIKLLYVKHGVGNGALAKVDQPNFEEATQKSLIISLLDDMCICKSTELLDLYNMLLPILTYWGKFEEIKGSKGSKNIGDTGDVAEEAEGVGDDAAAADQQSTVGYLRGCIEQAVSRVKKCKLELAAKHFGFHCDSVKKFLALLDALHALGDCTVLDFLYRSLTEWGYDPSGQKKANHKARFAKAVKNNKNFRQRGHPYALKAGRTQGRKDATKVSNTVRETYPHHRVTTASGIPDYIVMGPLDAETQQHKTSTIKVYDFDETNPMNPTALSPVNANTVSWNAVWAAGLVLLLCCIEAATGWTIMKQYYTFMIASELTQECKDLLNEIVSSGNIFSKDPKEVLYFLVDKLKLSASADTSGGERPNKRQKTKGKELMSLTAAENFSYINFRKHLQARPELLKLFELKEDDSVGWGECLTNESIEAEDRMVMQWNAVVEIILFHLFVDSRGRDLHLPEFEFAVNFMSALYRNGQMHDHKVPPHEGQGEEVGASDFRP